jgi:simple sugar transport system ATP-binding protein
MTKRFGLLVAVDGVDFTVRPGEIHALLGENGAGKTTLMNILYGLYHADSGEILIDGRVAHLGSPRDALRAHIGMVHQHFMLVPVFTVAENVILGAEPVRRFGGFLDRAKARALIHAQAEAFGLSVDPDAVVENLPVGVQQRVEIVKALVREANLLILDEPTAALTPQETDELFQAMRSLRESGKSVVFITHKLGEVMAVVDRITVMRAGRVVGMTTPEATSESELASMMVGRQVLFNVVRSAARPSAPVLEVEDLLVADERGGKAVDGLSLTVHGGEILAVAGVQGNGQTELARALFGLAPTLSGRIRLEGRDLTGCSPHQVARAGVGYIPEDRQREGLVLGFSVAENLMLDLYDRPPFARGLRFSPRAVRANAESRFAEFDIRAASTSLPVSALSGGNQQKVVLAREFSRPLKLLIASQPTRGLDVGSTEIIHRRLIEARDSGAAVLVVSTELDEVLALGDRIAVMYRGRISGYATSDTPREQIGLLMAGVGGEASLEPVP